MSPLRNRFGVFGQICRIFISVVIAKQDDHRTCKKSAQVPVVEARASGPCRIGHIGVGKHVPTGVGGNHDLRQTLLRECKVSMGKLSPCRVPEKAESRAFGGRGPFQFPKETIDNSERPGVFVIKADGRDDVSVVVFGRTREIFLIELRRNDKKIEIFCVRCPTVPKISSGPIEPRHCDDNSVVGAMG